MGVVPELRDDWREMLLQRTRPWFRWPAIGMVGNGLAGAIVAATGAVPRCAGDVYCTSARSR